MAETAQFRNLVAKLRQVVGKGPAFGDLVEFLAYSGLRIRSEAIWVNWEDLDLARNEIFVRGHPQTGTKNGEIRRVPIIGDMEQLLSRLLLVIQSPGRAHPCPMRAIKYTLCNSFNSQSN